MNLEEILPSEINQTQDDKHYKAHEDKKYKIVKIREADSGVVVTRGWGRGSGKS